jgi:hypothetical protein
MHAGFKRIAPEMDPGTNQEEPTQQAFALFHATGRACY